MGQRKVRLTKEQFVERARAVHGDKYDYSEVVYVTAATPVKILCPEHGPFYPRPNNHVSNRSGCPGCSGYSPTSLEQFLERARAVHGDRYDYSRVEYRGVQKKVEIICPEHGAFWQIPLSHTQGRGCAQCGVAQSIKTRSMTASQFAEKARAVHGDRYDYSHVQMESGFSKVEIICPDHGSFWQVARDHLSGNGCQVCSGLRPIDRETFVARARETHGDRYEYGEYRGWRTPSEIICAKHGLFWQSPKDHVNGSNCPACVNAVPVTRQTFIERARAVHGERYDYSRVKIANTATPVTIVCREHGPFDQRPADHAGRGYGCPECAGHRPIDAGMFLSRALEVHGDRYQYNIDTYAGYRQKTEVVCADHGSFWMTPQNHIAQGSGCPACARESTTSRAENALGEWVESLGFETVRNDRAALDGLELDIYVPDRRIGIEYNGSWWHSDEKIRNPRQHEYKAIRAEKAGVRLIMVWDFDLLHREKLVKRHLRHALGATEGKRFHARACDVRLVNNDEANALYDEHHIQGGVRRHMISFGLRHRDTLVACMSFLQGGSRRGRTGDDEWELIRYATAGVVRGGASRLFSAFLSSYAPTCVWSFSDRQHFSGALYPALGFVRDGVLAADYRVVHKQTLRMWSKASWQRRLIPKRLAELGIDETYDPETDPRTEREMQALAKVVRVMDAGKIRWKWSV